jgi:hypothetical protein
MAASNNGNDNKDEDTKRFNKTPSMPLPVKQNGIFRKSFSDEVFEMPSTPKTPRSIPTPGNCKCKPIFSFIMIYGGDWFTTSSHQPHDD